MRKKTLVVILILAALSAAFYFRDRWTWIFFNLPQPSDFDRGAQLKYVASASDVETVATGLRVPWEIAFLPDGGMLVTERPGTLRKIGSGGFSITVEDVHQTSEGGLLGMALHPDFAANHLIYLYSTTDLNGALSNRVERYRLDGGRLQERTTIIQAIPAGEYHDGGRIAFGPDRKLYVATGDSGDSALAQDKTSLAGKILRLNDDGTTPSDNPFGTPVWSYGHRNVQGLAWDDRGRMWATEHGRSGALSGLDEINQILPGKNYGWPDIQGDETAPDMESPYIQSGPWVTWAPSGMAFLRNSLFFAGLRGSTLYQLKLNDPTKNLIGHFQGAFGRLRAVKMGPDGFLYISTSNTDGRGKPRDGDDRIIKINPKVFDKQ